MLVKKSLTTATFLVASALLLSACGSPATAQDVIVIGMDEDSTGPGAAYATVGGATVRDAIDQINEAGGISGKQVKLIVENDESDPTKTPAVLRKLIDHDAQAIILLSGSGAVMQGKTVLADSKIIGVAPVTLSESFALPPNNEFSYMIPNPLSNYVDVYCAAFQKMGYKKLAVLSDSSAAIDGVNKLLLPGIKKCVEVVAEEKAPVDTADLSAQAARLKDSKADAILVSSVGGNFEILAHNTLYQQIPLVQRFSLASIGNQHDAWATAQKGALENVVFMGSLSPKNSKTTELTKFLKEKRGADYVPTSYDAQAYDAVQLIKQAIEKAGGAEDNEKLSTAMNQTSAYAASFGNEGFTLSFTTDKHYAAGGLCGLVLTQFGADNTPRGPWAGYQPSC